MQQGQENMQVSIRLRPEVRPTFFDLINDKTLVDQIALKVFKSLKEGLNLVKNAYPTLQPAYRIQEGRLVTHNTTASGEIYSSDPLIIRFYLGRVINQVNHNFYDYWFRLKDICSKDKCWDRAFEINHSFLQVLVAGALKSQLDANLSSEWSFRFRIRKCTCRLGPSQVYQSSASSYLVNSLDVIFWRGAPGSRVSLGKRLTMCFSTAINPHPQRGSIELQEADETQPVDHGEYDFYARAFNWDHLLSNWQPCRTRILGVDPRGSRFTLLLDEDVIEHVADRNIDGDEVFFKSCSHKELK